VLLGVEIAVVVAMRGLGLAGEVRRLAETRRGEARRRLPWWREVGARRGGEGVTREP